MVHVASPRPNIGSALGGALGGIGGQIGGQEYQRYRTTQDLNRLRQNSQNASPTDLAFNLAEAAALNPALARAIGPLYQTLVSQQKANAYTNIEPGGIGSTGRVPTPEMQQMLRTKQQQGQIGSQGTMVPTEQASKFFPSNIGPNEAPGNLPQAATAGLVRPILSGDELVPAIQNQLRRMQQVSPLSTWEDAERVVKLQNDENKVYNQQVESERQARIAEQESYGQLSEDAYTKLFPEATGQTKAYARKIGEDFAGKGKSQGDIRRAIETEATKFKNTVSNIQNGLNAPRIQNKLQRKIAGNEKSIKQAQDDARVQVQPLIKDGLYDLAREVTSKAGFYPEERENIVFGDIKSNIKKKIASIPKAKITDTSIRGKPGSPAFGLKFKGEKVYSPDSQEELKNNLIGLWDGKKVNDDINLLQMRKQYEDKGYDWRVLKDTLNDLFINGEIDFNDDQMNQFNSYMAEPPLTLLESIFQGLGLRGR